MSKWFTCAPARFEGTAAFFWRDSGLICRGLQELGYESKVVLPGPAFDGESSDILRATRTELESAEWWRSLKLEGVIMVAWARHRDTPIVRAIVSSGAKLVLHVDGNGSVYPLFDQVEHLKTLWRAERGTGCGLAARSLAFLNKAVIDGARLLIRHTYLRYRHLRYTTVASYQTPTSFEQAGRLCRLFGGRNHGVNLQLTGYPIPVKCRWDPAIPKEKRIIAIGNWEILRQKRANVLMEVCARIASIHPDLQIDIFGARTGALTRWHQSMEGDLQKRIHLHGFQPGEVVTLALQKAQVSFFPSAHEGGPQAMFEGLSCGVTTVSLDSPDLQGARWAAACHHGDLAARDSTEAYVAALDRALGKWGQGEYSPKGISEFWIPRTQVQSVIKIMLDAAAG